MNRKKGILKITLQSDLCVSSGYSYAGIIDSDVCYNENGIPYIPGRRLKGCLREAGELLRVNGKDLDAVFGSSGSSESGSVMIGNAYPMRPREYEELNSELTALRESGGSYASCLTQQKVLKYYTMIKAQTRIDREKGVAQDGSLRYTRVVKQYLPDEQEPLSFYADIEYDCEEETLGRIVKALRHIGMNRTRGLGNVTCSLESVDGTVVGTQRTDRTVQTSDEGELFRLDYVVRNEQPLMLSMGNDRQTELFISGTSVLGALASAYLAQDGKSAESEMFRDIFLKGKVVFTNLTPTVKRGRDFECYSPAPLFLNRLKKTRKLVNLAADREGRLSDGDGRLEDVDHSADYDPGDGNQPKKLNTQFACFPSGDCTRAVIAEPVVEIVYHHSKKQPFANGEPGILYSLEVLREGQFFKGSILADRKYIDELLPLLSGERTLRFGKSKSAQYGSCHVVELVQSVQEPVSLRAGERILVVLESDSVFCNEVGYTIRYPDVRKELALTLGLDVERQAESDRDGMKTTVINGYNTMWNLKKHAIPAVKAGSFFEYVMASDCQVTYPFAGEKNLEGFGRVGIYRVDGMTYAVKEERIELQPVEPKNSSVFLRGILREELREWMKESAWKMAATENLKCSASTLGRITLMLKESLAGHREEPGKAYIDYQNRIRSIKRKKEREEAERLLGRLKPERLRQLCEESELYGKLAEYETEDSMAGLIESLWGESMMNLLTCLKYRKSRLKKAVSGKEAGR